MDGASFWQTLWTALGGVAVVGTAIGFALKRVFDQILKRDLERYKTTQANELADYKKSIDMEVDRFRSALQAVREKDLEHLRSENATRLERVRSELASTKAEEDARRAYEYEARQKVYEQYEPLFFQLVETCESAVARVRSLARVARHGEISPEGGWLSVVDYYLLSTIYNLMAPMAVFRMIKKRLTLFDLTLVPLIEIQYMLGKQLYYLYVEHHDLASDVLPKLQYTPNVDDWEQRRQQDPSRYWRQGLAVGRLDNAVMPLLREDQNGIPQLVSYGDFERAYHDIPDVQQEFQVVVDLFTDFHPRTRPVLWRLLITQIYLCEAIADTATMRGQQLPKDYRPIYSLPETSRIKLDWRRSEDGVPAEHALVEPFQAAEQFLDTRLARLCRWNVPAD